MLSSLVDKIGNEARNRTVSRLAIGLTYICAEIDGAVGLSANLPETKSKTCTVFKGAGKLTGSKAGEILEMVKKGDLLSRSICLSVINALASLNAQGHAGDVLKKISIIPGEKITMVGLIEPVAEKLSSSGALIDAFDNAKEGSPFLRPKEEMEDCLAHADVVFITATTLINNILGEILGHIEHAREVVLMGPSTPMVRDIFTPTKITWLAGSHVINADKAFTIVMEGGGTRPLLATAAEKIIMKIRRPEIAS
jgi:uncharacterized protein (DUF4213/DUF364 family)